MIRLGCARSLLLCTGFLQLQQSGATFQLQCPGFSVWWLLLLRSTGSRGTGVSSCSMQAQQPWSTGLVGPQHGGSSQTRDQKHVPCIARWILNHWTTREALLALLQSYFFHYCMMRVLQIHQDRQAMDHLSYSLKLPPSVFTVLSNQPSSHGLSDEQLILQSSEICDFSFFAMPHGTWDLSSLTRDQTHAPCS